MRVISIDLGQKQARIEAFGETRTVHLEMLDSNVAQFWGFVYRTGKQAEYLGLGYIRRVVHPRAALHRGVDIGTWVVEVWHRQPPVAWIPLEGRAAQ